MKLQVIVGSVRPNRVSDRVAKWVANEAKNLADTEVEIIDLVDYPLPFLDEPISPQANPERQPNAVAKKWLDKISQADAFALITPEYNRSYSPVLKNALDYADYQFAKKPVALVAHGSTGGAQAIAHLRGVLPGLLTITVPQAVFLVGGARDLIDETGNLSAELKAKPFGPQTALKTTLESLKWYSDALALARTQA
ncbi:MAG: NADPH-dependent FMN reductase [Candidatus Saccharimonadales bacterium]